MAVIMDPSGFAKIDALASLCVANVVDDVETAAKRRVPVDTGELEGSIWSWSEGQIGRVMVGTDHWGPTEYGSRPHTIEAHGNYPLRNRETGQVFGRKVRHPGTPEQAFMRPSLYTKRKIRTGR